MNKKINCWGIHPTAEAVGFLSPKYIRKIKVKGLSKEDATKFVNWFELEGIFSFNAYIGNLTCGNVTIDLDSIDEEDNEFEIHLSRDGND